jgi:hypothetical protein
MQPIEKALLALKPAYSGYDLIRLGGEADGGYLCPSDLDGIVGCISPGAYNIKSFEDHLWNNYKIRSIIIDASSSENGFKTPMLDGQSLIKKWLSPIPSFENISFEDIAKNSLLPSKGDLILQMDIEGSEYDNLATIDRSLLDRFRIILIELHSLSLLKRPLSRGATHVINTLLNLSRSHMCVHIHPNNICGSFHLAGSTIAIPEVAECTFIRKDRVLSGLKRIAVELPHPLDSPNVPELPDLVLDRLWSDTDSSFLRSLINGRFKRATAGLLTEFKFVVNKLVSKPQ